MITNFRGGGQHLDLGGILAQRELMNIIFGCMIIYLSKMHFRVGLLEKDLLSVFQSEGTHYDIWIERNRFVNLPFGVYIAGSPTATYANEHKRIYC